MGRNEQAPGPSRPNLQSSSSQAEAAERRLHRRYLEEVSVRFRDLESSAPSRWGRTRNLSLGGLLLVLEKPIPSGRHLALELHVENETAPILALGQVLRCAPDEGSFRAGLQFLWVSAEDRKNLERLAAFFRSRYGDDFDAL